MTTDKDPRDGISDALALLFGMAIAMWIASLLASCSPETIAVPEYHTEYIVRTDTLVRHDSIYHHDSVSVYMQGETICRDRYKYIDKYKYIHKTTTDTVVKVDSIKVPVPIERQLTRWEHAKMDIGGWCIMIMCGLLIGAVAYILYNVRG